MTRENIHFAERNTQREAERETGSEGEGREEKERERQRDRQIDRETDRGAEREHERKNETEKPTHRERGRYPSFETYRLLLRPSSRASEPGLRLRGGAGRALQTQKTKKKEKRHQGTLSR